MPQETTAVEGQTLPLGWPTGPTLAQFALLASPPAAPQSMPSVDAQLSPATTFP